MAKIRNRGQERKSQNISEPLSEDELVHQRIDNFDALISRYGFDRDKAAILLDSRITPQPFIDHLKSNDIDVLDFAPSFEEAGGSRRTTLIYDQHWNNHGRRIISELISEHIRNDVK